MSVKPVKPRRSLWIRVPLWTAAALLLYLVSHSVVVWTFWRLNDAGICSVTSENGAFVFSAIETIYAPIWWVLTAVSTDAWDLWIWYDKWIGVLVGE